MNPPLYKVQREALEAFREETNLIVALPTGSGKTRIGCEAINDMVSSGGKMLFVVPTTALRKQQTLEIKKYCKGCIVEEVTNRGKWGSRFCHVFVATPDSTTEALVDRPVLLFSSISLLILDECHNSTGSSPYAKLLRILKDYQTNHPSLVRTKVLGLTASPHHGDWKSMQGLEDGLKNLRDLFQARIWMPRVGERCELKEKQREYVEISFQREVEKLELNSFVPPHDLLLRSELGERGVVKNGVNSDKLVKLVEVVGDSLDGTTKMMLFAQEVVLVQRLYEILQQEFPSLCISLAFGQKQAKSVTAANIEAFKRSVEGILLCTSAMEEGIDIASCNVVIRFSKITTTRSFVQGTGRARHEASKIYLFENQSCEFQRKQLEMENCSRQASATVDTEFGIWKPTNRYPYENITFWNAVKMYHEYHQLLLEAVCNVVEKTIVYVVEKGKGCKVTLEDVNQYFQLDALTYIKEWVHFLPLSLIPTVKPVRFFQTVENSILIL